MKKKQRVFKRRPDYRQRLAEMARTSEVVMVALARAVNDKYGSTGPAPTLENVLELERAITGRRKCSYTYDLMGCANPERRKHMDNYLYEEVVEQQGSRAPAPRIRFACPHCGGKLLIKRTND